LSLIEKRGSELIAHERILTSQKYRKKKLNGKSFEKLIKFCIGYSMQKSIKLSILKNLKIEIST
jgi:hypothetical protein